ncbi:MAG: hypothetical protein COA41_04515 [Sphingopyxis sp.]|nr:MAG: hypothetical protein COA41_04515 [Sphingopyxis sp.]
MFVISIVLSLKVTNNLRLATAIGSSKIQIATLFILLGSDIVVQADALPIGLAERPELALAPSLFHDLQGTK